MYYIIEYNTDMRCPNEKFHKFNTLSQAKKFESKYQEKLAFPNQARKDIPGYSQNWHNTILSKIYELPKGFNLKRESDKLKPKEYIHPSTYPDRYNSTSRRKTDAVYKYGNEVLV